VERDEHAHVFERDVFGRRLESVEQRAFAARQMHSGGPGPADRLEDFLNELELVGCEGIVPGEIGRVLVRLERHPAIGERELVFENVAFRLEERLKLFRNVGRFGEQARLNDLIHVGARQGQAGLEAALNLREVVGLALRHFAQNGVNVFLRGDHDPGAPLADGAQLFGDRLQVEHQMRVGADELADFVNEEDQPAVGAFRVEVILHPLAEVFDRQRKAALGAVNPLFGGFGAELERLRKGCHDFVAMKMISVPLRNPFRSGRAPKRFVELLQLASAFEVTFQVGDVRVVAAVTLHFVQDLEEDREDRVAPGAVVGLAINVEEDDIGVRGDGAFDVAEEHGVFDLAFEEFNRLPALAVVSVRAVPQQVREDFDEVRFAGAEETRDPDTDLAGCVGVASVFEGFTVSGEETAEVFVEFAGDDEFVQFLPDRGFIQLVCFDHAVDGAEDVPLEEVLNFHKALSLLHEFESSVVIIVLQLAEKPQRLPVVTSGIEHHQRRPPDNRMQVVEKSMRPQQRPDAPHARKQYQIVLSGRRDFSKDGSELVFVKRAGQSSHQGFAALLPLQLEGFVEQSAILQIIEHKVEQVDVLDAQRGFLLRQGREQRADVVAHLQFPFGRVIEDVESDLGADPSPVEEIVGDDRGQHSIQAFGQRIVHAVN